MKTIGFGREEKEINELVAQAHQEIAHLLQLNGLPFKYEEDQKHLDYLRSSILSVQPSICIRILERIFNEIGFSTIAEPLFRYLVVMRLLYPVSKLKTVEYLYRHYQIHYDVDYVYRYMDKIYEEYQDQLQQISFNHTKDLLGEDLSVVFYDVTTLYFEAEREDDLRKKGFSKDGKAQNPQIVLGLLVSAGGYPLAYEMFEGNRFEGKTMLPVIEKFRARYGLGKLIVIADAGLLSSSNMAQLISSGYEFILGGRLRNETDQIKKQILSLDLKDGQSVLMERPDGLKLIVSYANARASKDEYNRTRGLQKLEKHLKSGKISKEHLNNRGYNKYLKLEGQMAVSIDYDKFKKDAQWDGLKSYLTNSKLSRESIMEHYKSLWQIERAFRVSKSDLRVRPIYHRLQRRIRSHLNIAFCSYKLYMELGRQLKLKGLQITTEKALETMKSIYTVNTFLPASKRKADIIIVMDEDQKSLLDAFEIPY